LDLKHMCPSRAFALAGAASAPTWRWIFTHHLENADWPVDRWGATHGDDMALLWQDDWYPRTPDEEVLSWQLSRYMTNFAKGGEPNEPGVLPFWPQFTVARQEYLDVEVPLATGTLYHAQECDAIDNMYDDAFQTCSQLCRLYFRAGGRYTDDPLPFPHGIQKRFP